MKEMADILAAWQKDPDNAVLATVAQTEGSSYRRPGARMMILAGGETVGSISGGCVESDVIDKASEVRASNTARLLSYDTSKEEDVLFGAGLGCRGVVKVLLEPAKAPFMNFLERLFQSRGAAAIATVFQVDAERAGEGLGGHLILDENGSTWSDLSEAAWREALTADAREALRCARQSHTLHETAAGAFEALVEIMHGPQSLVIFGAGYDAIPLSRMARQLGYHVTIVDSRPAYADAKRFPEADAVVLARPGEWDGKLQITDRTAAIVMAHHYLTDAANFKALAPLTLRYLGLMGPRKRAEKIAAEMGLEGADILRRVHNPIGLDIGADSPEQIALAILAEIQAANTGRSGGPLRDKKGPIHAAHG